MKTFVWIAAGALMSLSAIGCTPSPEKVCNHINEIAENDPKLKELMGKQSEEKKKEGQEKCVAKITKEKESDPEGYKCGSKCIMASKDFEAMMKCEDECPGMKKKKGGGDDTEKAEKKKDDKKKDD
jgi:hypothetical protein